MSSDRVCHPCWLRSKRSALRTQETRDARSLTLEDANDSSLRSEPEQDSEQILEVEGNRSSGIPDVIVQPEIFLPNYKRAANTASHCLFMGCTNDQLHTMSDSLRATVLRSNNYYIPVLARICVEHLHGNNWDSLYNSSNSISTFTVQQIEHVFSFVNAFKNYVDFSSIEAIQNIDDNLFFTGLGDQRLIL